MAHTKPKRDLRLARTAAKPVTDKIAADQEEKIILYDNLREIKEREKTKVNANISAHILKYVEQVNLKGDKEADKNITVLKLLPAWIASKNPVSREDYRELIEAKDPKTPSQDSNYCLNVWPIGFCSGL